MATRGDRERGEALRFKVISIIGTRPEAIKMAPVADVLAASKSIDHSILLTGQHSGIGSILDRHLCYELDAPLSALDFAGQRDLMRRELAAFLGLARPDLVLVQGDTTSALAGALAATDCGIAIAHVEAGLRSHDREPWPEEDNRIHIDSLSSLLFAPTRVAAANLANDDTIWGIVQVTGTFNGLAQGAVFFVGANAFQISYNGGDGNDVVLTVVSLCNTVSIPTGISTRTGQVVTVPINVDDTTGKGLLSYDFTITYNPAVINSPTVDWTGTLSSGMTVTTNSLAGTLKVSGFSANPLAGAGTLLKINFNAVGAVGSTSGVNFTSFMFNEGGACLSTTNGSVNIASGSITGTVNYGNALPAGLRPVPNTTLSAAGSINVTTATGSAGTYSLSGMGSGAYTVTPSKSGGFDPVTIITSNDAARIAQHSVGIVTLDANQMIAADVSGTGGVTSFDAALIARFTVGLPGAGSTGTWKFVPTSRSYSDVTTDHAGDDYQAYLMGDVTGNWVAPTPFAGLAVEPEKPAKDAIRVEMGSFDADRDGTFNVPLKVADTGDKGIISYQFDVIYDPTVLEAQATLADAAETLSGRMNVVTNVIEPGTLKVAVYGAYPLVGDGVLLNLHFKAIGEVGSKSDLKFVNFMFNEGLPSANPVDGKVTVQAAASNSEVNGRLLTAAGRPVANTSVTLTSVGGEVRRVRSNTFGAFRFGGLQQGQTYTLSAESKRYTFTPVTVSVGDGAANQDLIAQQ